MSCDSTRRWSCLGVTFTLALLALAPPARAEAEALAPVDAKSCTTGCHEDVKHENAGHAQVTCLGCHPNVPDGQKDHAGALDDQPTEVMCATAGCHPDQTANTRKGFHKDAPCEGCHNDSHGGTFARFDVKACKSCHKDEVATFDHGVHAQAKEPVACGDCHGDLHDIKKSKDPLSPMSKVLQVTTCSECHTSKYVRAYRESVHGRGLLKSGLAVAPACTDCHGAHEIGAVKTAASKLSRQHVTETCGACHEFIVARWKTSTHGQLAAKGDTKGPVCTTCHSGHKTLDPMVYGNHLAMAETCGQCHPEQNASYRDSFHGKATRMGYAVAATCADCHTPHEMLPAKDPKSSVNAAHLKETCTRCHENATDQFIAFAPHLEPSNPKSGVVYDVWLFMTTLLLGTLGFFGVHTLLWLQRSLWALWKKELPGHSADEVWVRRFVPLHVWIHVSIVLTFLTLAATGLPLKFSGEDWAQTVGVVFGGLHGSRWLHRAAGVLTFAYGVTFLGYLVREVGLKRRKGLFFGWQSMVPNGKDFKDLMQNLRWFLHLGPRPELDRWAYWEKFDFFAVFWGVPVIGLSGLVLWAPQWFTHFLPGWSLNVAYLIHSDEALLATGFIFFFHFFHTHLRPEAFPLDPVIFTGSMPRSRFQHERPKEYERLLASGELLKLEVPPPSERTLRRVYRFGGVAVTVGVLLGVFLFMAAFHSLLR